MHTHCRERRAEKWEVKEIEKMRLRKEKGILVWVRIVERRNPKEELVNDKKKKKVNENIYYLH